MHSRCDIRASSLPDTRNERQLQLDDKGITNDGVIVIKAQRYRMRKKNLKKPRPGSRR